MRTTLDIDDPILADLKRLQKRDRKSLGRLVSDLLAQALAAQKSTPEAPCTFRWHSKAMQARVNLSDKAAVFDAMDDAERR